MELISIKEEFINGEEQNTVDARELHKFLEVKSLFRKWIQRRIEEHGFIEDFDYRPNLTAGNSGGSPQKDYFLTLDTAKHIALSEKTEKGRQIRQYFIDVEKQARKICQLSPTMLQLEQHLDEHVQKSNSKLINSKNYQEKGLKAAIRYNTENCKAHTGLTPKGVKVMGRAMGFKASECTSSKEVMRRVMPEVACSMSLTDKVCRMTGKRPKEVHERIAAPAIDTFKGLLSLGVTPAELSA